MNTRPNIDFHNPSDQLLFRFCMKYVGGWQLTEEVQYNVEREAFRDLLVKNDLQQYTDLLLDYQIKWLDIARVLDQRRTMFDDNEKNTLPYKVKIATILKMLLAGEEKNYKNLEFSVSGLYNVKVSESGLFNSLK